MDPILNFLSSNPIILYTLFLVLVILATILTFILIDAYRKGYPLSLWIFKIGERSPNKDAKKEDLLENDDVNAFFEKVIISNRSGFKRTFMERIRKANSVSMLGINLNSLISPHTHFIEGKAKNDCRFKFIMVDYQFFESMGAIAYTTWPGGTNSQKDLGQSVDKVTRLNSSKNNNIQLRFISVPPPYSMLLIDPETDHGEIQIELYTYQRDTYERPHFILTRKENPHWYDFFLHEFNIAWNKSRLYQPQLGPKQIQPKAGIVLYKQVDNHYEVLIVTARFQSDIWIFPVGMLEKNECLQQTAIREGGEESGYFGDPCTLEPLGDIYIDRGELIDQLTFFLSQVATEQPDHETERQRKWVRLEELDNIILDEFRPIVQSVKNKLEKKR